ncbi:hypothetical protein [uncultured Brevundimonas sp.]|uniref:hypothetical protein n=1 Tax=uncultured Brevundimonas sp. TaxID=213418 RepID=UPI0030ED2870
MLRILILSLAFVGFIGQTTARATPFSAAPDMPDCVQMTMGAMDDASAPGQAPCKHTKADCLAKMGCTVVSPVFSFGPTIERPVSGLTPTYDGMTGRLVGLTTLPPRDPPKA